MRSANLESLHIDRVKLKTLYDVLECSISTCQCGFSNDVAKSDIDRAWRLELSNEFHENTVQMSRELTAQLQIGLQDTVSK